MADVDDLEAARAQMSEWAQWIFSEANVIRESDAASARLADRWDETRRRIVAEERYSELSTLPPTALGRIFRFKNKGTTQEVAEREGLGQYLSGASAAPIDQLDVVVMRWSTATNSATNDDEATWIHFARSDGQGGLEDVHTLRLPTRSEGYWALCKRLDTAQSLGRRSLVLTGLLGMPRKWSEHSFEAVMKYVGSDIRDSEFNEHNALSLLGNVDFTKNYTFRGRFVPYRIDDSVQVLLSWYYLRGLLKRYQGRITVWPQLSGLVADPFHGRPTGIVVAEAPLGLNLSVGVEQALGMEVAAVVDQQRSVLGLSHWFAPPKLRRTQQESAAFEGLRLGDGASRTQVK